MVLLAAFGILVKDDGFLVVLALRSLYYAGIVLVQVAAERGLFTLAFNVQVFNFCHFTIDTRCYKLFTV
jgi:hypothetical protein